MKQIIMRYLKPYFPRMGVGFVIKFIGTIMDLGIPYILAYIIDTVIPLEDRGLVLRWGSVMVLCSLLAVSFNIIANRMASKVASDATESIRHDLFSKTMGLSNARTDHFTKPSLISRMTSDTYNMHQMLGRMQRLGVRAPILLIGGLCVTFTLDPVMACVLLAVLPLLGFITVYVSRRSIPMYGGLQEANDRFVRMVREDISGIRVIKALSKTDYETRKFRDINREVVERERRNGMVMAVIDPSMNILLNLGLVGVILVGAWRVNAGISEVGKILAFTTYFTIILNAMMSLAKMFTIMSKAIASGNRIWEVLKSEEDMEVLENEENKEVQGASETAEQAGKTAQHGETAQERAAAVARPELGVNAALGNDETVVNNEETVLGNEETALGTEAALEKASSIDGQSDVEICFDHVSFSYLKKGEPNIKDLSFRIKRGETLGIIGEIGSGKSTIINLLMRLYDADQGRVLVTGRDVRSYEPGELKKKFGVVFQNDTIFEDTIAGNVTLGREMSREQIREALVYAQAGEFVENRDDKEAEALSIKGANLSGGQKQRVLIARALAAKPEILILDDSSSALDYRTDARLRQGIREHFRDTTLVIVAQRVSSIRSADHILVLEDGAPIGYGTHEELMQSCELYREIAKSQMGGGAEEGVTDANIVNTTNNADASEKTAGVSAVDATVRTDTVGKRYSGRTIRNLCKYMLQYKWMLALALLCTLGSNLFTLIGPKLTGLCIGAIEAGKGKVDFGAVGYYAAWMAGFYVISAAMSYGLQVLMLTISRKVVYRMRQDVFEKLMTLPVGYFDVHQTGDIISRISYDIDTVNASLSNDLVQLLTTVITVVGALVMMLTISPRLVLVFAFTVPLSLLTTRYITGKTRPLFRMRSAKLGEMNGFVEEMITGQKTLKAYGREAYTQGRFDGKNKDAVDAYYRAEYYGSIVGPCVNFINNLSLSLISVFGALLYLAGHMSIGDISSFVLYSRKFSGPINEAANIFSELQSALAAAERVFRLLEEEPEPADGETAVALTNVRGDVKLQHVSFGYTPGKTVIHDLSFRAEPGKLIAIVGPTGAGKTTLINLLMRFYDPDSGVILVDGRQAETFTRRSLRQAYAMVLQDTWLFYGSIYENLAYGKAGVTKEEVEAVAKAAHIHSFIKRLPQGYDTILTDEGTNISKGQKQLLTIARAMLLDARMLILDEATSNVDTRTERQIQKAMLKLMEGKTCFVIAHRLSTIEHADLILVVNDGEVVEQGTHRELMERGGVYRRLYNAQFE